MDYKDQPLADQVTGPNDYGLSLSRKEHELETVVMKIPPFSPLSKQINSTQHLNERCYLCVSEYHLQKIVFPCLVFITIVFVEIFVFATGMLILVKLFETFFV